MIERRLCSAAEADETEERGGGGGDRARIDAQEQSNEATWDVQR